MSIENKEPEQITDRDLRNLVRNVSKINQDMENLTTTASNIAKTVTNHESVLEKKANYVVPGLIKPLSEELTFFYGRMGESFKDFLELFNTVAAAESWSDIKKMKTLPAFLREAAKDVYNELTEEEKKDFATLTRNLKSKLQPAESERFYQNSLVHRKQMPTESVSQFAYMIRKLVLGAYPDYPAEHQQSMMLTHFLSKLRPELGFPLNCYGEPIKTFADARTRAQKLEAQRKLYESPTVSVSSLQASTDCEMTDACVDYATPSSVQNACATTLVRPQIDSTAREISALTNHLTQLEQTLTEKLNALQVSRSPQTNFNRRGGNFRQPQRGWARPQPFRPYGSIPQNRTTPDGRPICFKCGKPGHIGAMCYSQGQNNSFRGRGGSRNFAPRTNYSTNQRSNFGNGPRFPNYANQQLSSYPATVQNSNSRQFTHVNEVSVPTSSSYSNAVLPDLSAFQTKISQQEAEIQSLRVQNQSLACQRFPTLSQISPDVNVLIFQESEKGKDAKDTSQPVDPTPTVERASTRAQERDNESHPSLDATSTEETSRYSRASYLHNTGTAPKKIRLDSPICEPSTSAQFTRPSANIQLQFESKGFQSDNSGRSFSEFFSDFPNEALTDKIGEPNLPVCDYSPESPSPSPILSPVAHSAASISPFSTLDNVNDLELDTIFAESFTPPLPRSNTFPRFPQEKFESLLAHTNIRCYSMPTVFYPLLYACILFVVIPLALAIPAPNPLLCRATAQGRTIWRLPEIVPCKFDVNSTICTGGDTHNCTKLVPSTVQIYKRNYVKYRTTAWVCKIITQKTKAFTYLFADENLVKHETIDETVSESACQQMKDYKRCESGNLVQKGGIWQTENEHNWEYPGGGIYCCKWKTFITTNCFIYQTVVYKRHNIEEMESPAGLVSQCKYENGHCQLSEGSYLLWDISKYERCEFLPIKNISGNMHGKNWLSDDGNLALTTTTSSQTHDCSSNPIQISDQGIGFRFLNSAVILDLLRIR